MPLFKYRALSAEGKAFSGVIDADSLSVAKERLRKQQVMVTELMPAAQKSQELILPPPLLLAFTRELTQLLRAGLPLYESLTTIEEKYRRHKSHPLLLDLCDQLKNGFSLSAALRKYPKTFDQIYLSMVQAGEQSGNLPYVFEQLFQLITRQHKLKKQLFSTFAYPCFLGIFCMIIVCGLLFFVIPSMKELFEDRPVHPLTHFILMVSQFANDHLLGLLISLLSFITGLWLFFRHPKSRLFFQQRSLQIPFLKTLILHSSLVRFCRSTAMLLKGGVPLLQALSYSQNVLKNLLLEKAVKEAEKKIIEGQPLSAALRNDSVIPPLVNRMISLAEETGKMGEAFQNLAEIYEEEVDKHLGQLTLFLQPALLIILGAIVGMVILSILLPLTDVNSFLNN